MKIRSFFKKALGYFLQGVLLTVPVAATIYVIIKMFDIVDGILPFSIPGLGLLVLIVLLTVFGYIGSSIIAQPFIIYFRGLMDRAPLVKTIYGAVKDLVSAFVGQKKRFDQPVLVRLTRDADLEKPGFITRDDLSNLGIEGGKVAVYLPHSYAFSGNLFIVPKENVRPIDVSSADMMKFIVSGGVTTVDNE